LWIATTLIVIIIASSSILVFLNQSGTTKAVYNFDYIPAASGLVTFI
jgi:hypothetical protein